MFAVHETRYSSQLRSQAAVEERLCVAGVHDARPGAAEVLHKFPHDRQVDATSQAESVHRDVWCFYA